MYICQYGFFQEDPDSPGYSLPEVDYYAWIPAKYRGEVPNHRLSLRFNLVEKQWELYRAYSTTQIGQLKQRQLQGVVISFKPTGVEEIVYTEPFDNFNEILRKGNDEWNRWHKTPDYEREPDRPCTHRPPEMSTFCIVARQFRELRWEIEDADPGGLTDIEKKISEALMPEQDKAELYGFIKAKV